MSDSPEDIPALLSRLRQLQVALSDSESQRLEAWLEAHKTCSDLGSWELELFNEISGVLLRRPRHIERITAQFSRLSQDQKASVQVRGYAIQHLYYCWRLLPSVEDARRVEDNLVKLAKDADAVVQSTALVTLARCHGKTDEGNMTELSGEVALPVDLRKERSRGETRIQEALVAVLDDQASSALGREAVFTTAQSIGFAGLVERAWNVAEDLNQPEGVRCTAVGYLGQFGAPEGDLERLNHLEIQSTGPFLGAVKAARASLLQGGIVSQPKRKSHKTKDH